MKDTSLLEKILGKFLSHEQIVALIEEISKGVSVVNGIIDKNEKVKAKKEFVVETFKSIDRMIAQSNKIPATFKLFYDTAKIKLHDLLEPIISGMVMENDFSELDDIPDVKKSENAPKHENAARVQENTGNNQQQNGEQQGGRRRRNRRHGRNRNNNQYQNQNQNQNQNQEQKPEQKPEPKQEQKQEPNPEPKLEHKPEPKPVETSLETSQKPETSPAKPARRGRTAKKPAETPATKPEQKQESVPSNETPAAKKPAKRGRTPRKPKETNE